MSIKMHLRTSFNQRNLEEIKNLLQKGKPIVTFLGHRSVKLSHDNNEKTIKISRLLSMVENLSLKTNFDVNNQQNLKENKNLTEIKLILMNNYDETKEIVQQANLIHKILIFICDFIGFANIPSFNNHIRANLETMLKLHNEIEEADKELAVVLNL